MSRRLDDDGDGELFGMIGIMLILIACLLAALHLVGCTTGAGAILGAATNIVSQADGGTATTTEATTTTTHPPVEAAYRITKATASMIYWTGPDLDWPERDGCCGESHLIRADGRGGKFDHIRRNSKSRDWKNVRGGYGIFGTIGVPAAGEECELVLVSYDKTQRVSVGKFRWVN